MELMQRKKQMKLKREFQKSSIYLCGQLIFNKAQRQFNGEKYFLVNNAGTFGYPQVKIKKISYENTKWIMALNLKF